MIKENTYFEGNVKSLAFDHADQTMSVGVMAEGEYTFGTEAPEKMTIVKGKLTVKIKEIEGWNVYLAGESFDVPGDSSFDVKVEQSAVYLCEYL